ncbi:MAG TPA: 5-oxoprolinase subunit PxpB [Opitutaceae bacterium]|nr:5-oxoprolinase subunit PxpB [Opitutaceae bacterium]
MTLSPLGDNAVVLELGQEPTEAVFAQVQALAAALAHHPPPGVIDVVPAFVSVTVFYDLAHIGSYEQLCAELRTRAGRAASRPPFELGRLVEIPVCYAGKFAPDLAEVATHAGIAAAEVVALHAGAEYRVQAIGFVPGFPYLHGLAPRLHTPRRPSPRTQVPAGAVGIGGAQTGVYPFATPGGWNLIGRTPLALFRPEEEPAALLRMGDRVKFRAISPEDFAAWK